ncbi:RNA polymerase factor sigma-54 [Castellaniella caeni]|uniref:RNA polymerase factor sigma-54 n=1 Tax=Castellaniella caeni TaxID=266123 RepID=UPI000A041D43|nr:RNA polymerase factor sigma-54 [Castellaniella caeni]
MRSQPSLELGQHQQLVLTPQLRQALKLLQCSSQELEHEITQALADNPVLERADPAAETVAAEAERLDRHWAQPARRNVSDDIPESEATTSLTDHLLQQLSTTRATPRDQALVTLLIGELDARGYLDFDPQAYTAALPPELRIQAEEWQTALRLLQSFDPAGVGARSLAECLRLQLGARTGEWPTPAQALAARLTEHLDDLGAGRWGRLCDALHCTREALDAAHRVLLQLDPHPVSAWDTEAIAYVVPDLLFYREGQAWRVSLNPALEPRLRVDTALVAQLDALDAPGGLREQVRQAHGLIQQLGQRRQTILRVGEFIAEHQRAFLEQGARALRPLVLRDVAQALGLHESTISRATRMKYAQTPWGVFELKHFFGTGMQTASGEDASALAIQARMRTLLDAEPAAKPLSDARLTELLAAHGITIARRTVAKYREAMGVPPASLRKAQAEPPR